ncbi:flagellar hook-basal body complex protein [Bradyrhizobium sp.]|uniref:flagellar hook-basal body complex protein n=1 Tax=Bradyrhizobium sp. TaxID=376 RepID=UPI001D3A0ED0|nr:flagellar hook-basal body complex protein [Bradyrhizobium sp.]MBV8697088.1 flagellar hook-basal body complex protein [Bradyrhizobium sp.]MBV8922810.1 flagellar hook-basal body complex protein [Bradyrhizobium sp.]MBV9981623.1 flagellar hook-basal body complex protein [Bradyrhizobium sp.]
MGIFDALNTSVGGLQAQSFALQNISGNIANASTTGYKGIGTSFEDLIPDATTPSRQVAGGVTAFAQATITTQGTVSASTVATNMAINGDGFFSVQKASSITDNVPVFSGVTDYTRRGDFQLNANGNLINGAGYYLMGITVDPKTGNPTGNVPQVLQFQNNFIPAQATSSIQYAANLPTQPSTPASSTSTAGSITAVGGLNPADFASNPLPIGSPAPPVDASITGTVVNNQMGTPAPITVNTALSGTAPSDSLAAGFAAGDSITIDGTTINFVASGATGNQLNITDNVGALLNKIAGITGGLATVTGGQITLHTGTAQDLVITGNTANATTALHGLGFATVPISQARAPGTNVGTGTVTANDLQTFTNESISGGAVTTYNAAGTPINLQLRWAKTDSASLGSGHSDKWNLFYQTSTTATGTQTAWVNSGTTFAFNANGSLASPSGSSIAIPNVTVNGLSLGNLSFNLGSGALTQFASSSGAATINTITQNGFAAGQLQSVAVNNSGLVVGTFSNGQNIDLAQVTLSHFNGTNYLKALDGGAYEVTDLSGPAIIGASGKISGSSLESSNTDIADEFTKLIVTQQAYSANTKVITTANNMVQDLLNVLR